MRVVMVTEWYPSVAAPVSGVFVRRDAELIATAADVEVVHLVPPGRVTDADAVADRAAAVPIRRIVMDRTDPFDRRRVAGVLARTIEDADLLHTHAFTTLMAFAGRRVARPWVHSEHWSGVADPSGLTPRGRAIFRLTAPLLRRPDVVTTVSTYLADRVRRYRRGPISVVPSIVPPASLVPPPNDPGEIRLVAVGGLVEGKGPLLALETVRELARRGVGAHLTWVGEGPMRAALEQATREGDRLTLLGALDSDGVSAALDAADVFLLPTKGETLCLSALEAITHGRPVVMGARGGQRDYIVPDNGVLVGPRTPAAYADAVEEIRRRRGELVPERVAATIGDRFHGHRVLEGYLEAYALARAARGISG
ncbi:glycosyltransferase [Agromyces aurantiacus]|uniref:D-inositol 3-phosphate glycosyltransferase n=1 Tax=Agromyces aurantiacus TaxID=165814 RepID=A0ABV9R866_9MICO|nr:glycosyltransferase [Agromyces aurantiacus]MBM7504157.1 glycosyltransferase involved in cell wall biosynthesis [Agromyces aurantiacus]